ncbi:hypothetical protein HZF08_15890 [Paenibacillus sp. CGMCC 1.16610]|uniref:Uncharacterized protein n=1 Tax=Paenibacillus anseongense TaxID=2682845 RepID=A0ABW9UJN9_9BACL|nr:MULTISPECIES: hypothetical protein [Paenibacillus]MBA2939795.1 hypothetical protein [Paenibacillus sp. CGMCC 1.16610]MVQ39455.1 hypothetical protein [Paenibacillus anseongense]
MSEQTCTEYVLVSAPNRAGKEFINLLRTKGIQYYAITNNNYGKKRLEAMGVDRIIMVNTEDVTSWTPPEIRISKVYLFEVSFNLCCRYIQICKDWNPKSIHVITKRGNARVTYRALGADHFTYINNNQEASLLLLP